MKLYIDCVNGMPGAIESDQTAFFGIFDKNNNLIKYLEIERTGPIHLSGVLYKCIVAPSDVCVDQYNYVFELDLPKRQGGYTLAFQRCCRNKSINNLVDAEGTGATYWVHVPDRNIINTDNSPIFKKFPPIYICKGFPLVFDHSATDKDGDSLSYELYKPYTGADKDLPRPEPPANPPFKNVVWSSGFGTSNQMRGMPILEIDEITGELTVTPDLLGQFVIGVKVKEWRNGVLIGETLRDYQFNVRDCQAIAVANFKALVVCSDTVSFVNQSIGTTTYSWNFGDPSSGSDNMSTFKNPSHIYKKNGDYSVKLKAWNTACEDEYSVKVKIRTQKGFSLGKDVVFCKPIKQVMSVAFTDYSSILWSTGSKSSFISVTAAGTYWVEAKYGNCILRDTIKLGYNPVSFTPIPDSLFCDVVDVNLEIKNRSPKSKILWYQLADTSAKVHIAKEGKYVVQVYNANCTLTDTVNLTIARITPLLGADVFICNSFVHTLDAGAQPPGTNYLWSDGSTNRKLITTDPGKFWVRTQLKQCFKYDTMQISNSKVILELGPGEHFCDSVNTVLDAGPPANGVPTFYAWNTGDVTQKSEINKAGRYWVTKSDSFGCKSSDTIIFTMSISPTVSIGNDTAVICLRSPIKLTPGSGFTSYLWENGSNVKIREVELTGKYYITVTDEMGCKASDTIVVITNPNLLPNKVYIPNAFTPNGDGLNDVFPYEMPVLQSEYNLKIFNRWGEKVYDSDNTFAPWDGTTKSSDSQLDAYIWVVVYKGCDGTRHSDKGTVTIIR